MFSKAVRSISEAAQKLIRGHDPAERAVSADFVRSAYRVLLHREVEAEGIVDHQVASGTSEADLVMRMLGSLEFSRGIVGTRLATEGWYPQDAQHAANLAALVSEFKHYTGPGQSGFYMDFLGVRTRTRYVAAMKACDNKVLSPPIEGRPPLFEPVEWEGMLRSVLEAEQRMVAIELGAGWAPWLTGCHAAARQRGIGDIELAGVEASEEHFSFMLEHLLDNGIDPEQHYLFKGVVGTRDGFAHFPRVGGEDWGAQAVIDGEGAEKAPGTHVDYRGITFPATDRVPCIALATLLRRYDRIDLVHCDIQDSEGQVVPSAIQELSDRARRAVISTHSRASEGALLEAFVAAQWVLEADRPCRYAIDQNRIVLLQDGIQVWVNPRLAQSQQAT